MALIDNLAALLAQGQDGALLRYGLGGEYLKLERYADATQHLRKAVELDPNYSAASGGRDKLIRDYFVMFPSVQPYRNNRCPILPASTSFAGSPNVEMNF